ERASGRIYNVAEPLAYAEAEWVRRIADATGWQGDVVAVPSHLLPKHRQVQNDFTQQYSVASSRIRRELGYAETVSEDQGLRKTIEWERLNPPGAGFPPPDYAAEDS